MSRARAQLKDKKTKEKSEKKIKLIRDTNWLSFDSLFVRYNSEAGIKGKGFGLLPLAAVDDEVTFDDV